MRKAMAIKACGLLVAAAVLLAAPASATRGRRSLFGTSCTTVTSGGSTTCNQAGSTYITKIDTVLLNNPYTICLADSISSFDLYVKDANCNSATGGGSCPFTSTSLIADPCSNGATTQFGCVVSYTVSGGVVSAGIPSCTTKSSNGWSASTGLDTCLKVTLTANAAGQMRCLTITQTCKTGSTTSISHVALGNIVCCSCNTINGFTPQAKTLCIGSSLPTAPTTTDNCGNPITATTTQTSAVLTQCTSSNQVTVNWDAQCPGDATTKITRQQTITLTGGAVAWSKLDGTAAQNALGDFCPAPGLTWPTLRARQACDYDSNGAAWTNIAPSATTAVTTCSTTPYTMTYNFNPLCSEIANLQQTLSATVKDTAYTTPTTSGCNYQFNKCTGATAADFTTVTVAPKSLTPAMLSSCLLTLDYASSTNACGDTVTLPSRTWDLGTCSST